jgi:ATP-dependent helicase/nuclease subunit B
MYEDALYSELAPQLPVLLSAAQEQVLWEAAISGSESGKGVLSAARTAALAREAWALAHEWALMARLDAHAASDDGRAFADWARRYERATRASSSTDSARLPQLVAQHLASAAVRKAALLVLYGFDIRTPQLDGLVAAMEAAGVEVQACAPAAQSSRSMRIAFTSARDEIRAAARFARARLEARPEARIGIVVPDLQRSRAAVRRAFSQVMDPAGTHAASPFNISLGEPLSSCPLVAAALLALDIAAGEVPFSSASRLIRSPFIAGADSELATRARLDAELRKAAGATLDLAALRRMVARLTDEKRPYHASACPKLSALLARISRQSLRGLKTAGEWGRVISSLLDAAGHPGERPLDSAEYQALKKWHEALSAFAALERVARPMRFGRARERLARIAADTLFQPEAPAVPVQIIGVLESAGLEFDHLWVMGLTDEAWPLGARPNPFIPVALQRAAGVPQASAAVSLDLDRRITSGWLAAAGEVVFSHALREEDRELVPSPLIREVEEGKLEELGLTEYRTAAQAMRAGRREESVEEARGPALAPGVVRVEQPVAVSGGTAVFRDQAACPFRAFALHRLGAGSLEQPAIGLDAGDRGRLLHALLEKVWSELKSKARLDAASERDLRSLLETAADTAMNRLRWSRPDALNGRFAKLEKARLVKLALDWLAEERKRPAFEVAAIEEKHAVAFGGVSVNAKLDRMDRLVAGGQAIIDYKTGNVRVSDWIGPRPEDPQVPLYAVGRVAGPQGVSALAFARAKPGEMEFKGIARDKDLIPGVDTLAEQRLEAARGLRTWDALLDHWRGEFDALGREFHAGEARVLPKRGDLTCRLCDLRPLCRVNERTGK